VNHRSSAGGRAVALAAKIEAEIHDGGIPAGTRLGTKRDLCDRYNVSYGTLNEAIRVLQNRGFLETMGGPRGGLFATSPTVRVRLSYMSLGFDEGGTFDECATVRFALEEAVAVDAARSRTSSDVEEMERLLGEMERNVDVPGEYVRCNWALHRRIAETCSNKVLRNLYCTLLDANEAGLREVVPAPSFETIVVANVAAHGSIVAAIKAGSPEQAKAAVAVHAASRDRNEPA
jgi:DNA-binding FadR family transcriptional regulator